MKTYEHRQTIFPETLGIWSSDLFCSHLITDHISFPLTRFSAVISCPYPLHFSCFCKVLFLLNTVHIKLFFFHVYCLGVFSVSSWNFLLYHQPWLSAIFGYLATQPMPNCIYRVSPSFLSIPDLIMYFSCNSLSASYFHTSKIKFLLPIRLHTIL